MVVAVTFLQLVIVIVNARADHSELAKIKRCAFDRCQFPCGNEVVVHGGVATGIELQLVLENVSLALPF